MNILGWFKNPYFCILTAVFFCLNAHFLFEGKFSDARIFDTMSAHGDLSYWTLDIGMIMAVILCMSTIFIPYISNFRMNEKQLFQVWIFLFMCGKAVWDYEAARYTESYSDAHQDHLFLINMIVFVSLTLFNEKLNAMKLLKFLHNKINGQ